MLGNKLEDKIKVWKDLRNRLVNSIKGRDVKKFSRGISKIIKESQKENENADK